MAVRENKVFSVNRDRSENIGSVLVDRPDMKLVGLSYLIPFSLMLIAGLCYVLPLSEAPKVIIGFGSLVFAFINLTVFIPYHGRLRKAAYTVTSEYIEANTGTFEKSVRRVPLSYIRDVTHTQNFFQKLFGLSSIKVVATNGDSIALENISDGERKREIIWDLVYSRSPHTGRLKN